MINRSKSTLFLIEQLIVIAVFAICAVACISILAAAYFNANDSGAVSNALLKAESGAEVFKATGGDLFATGDIIGNPDSAGYGAFRLETGPSKLGIFYNKDWQLCEPGDASFILSIVTDANGSNTSDLQLITGTLTVERITGEELVAFPVVARRG